MSNISKSFEKKSALRAIRMADGGLVEKAATDLASRKSRLDEAENAAVGGQPTAPAKPQPAPAPKPQTDDEKRAAVGMPPKKGLLRTLLGMKEGGHVVGPGGPREDKVPAMLSDGEYVLPAKTVDKLGGPEELDELVRQTNDGREPATGLRRAAGGFIGPYPETISSAEQKATMDRFNQFRTPTSQLAGSAPAATSSTAVPSAAPTIASRAASIGTKALRAIPGMATTYAVGKGAFDTADDMNSDYGTKFKESLGIDPNDRSWGGAAKNVLGDAAMLAGNIGNAITDGYAERLGRGISSAFNGGTFGEGFAAPSFRESVTPAAKNSDSGTQLVGPPQDLAGSLGYRTSDAAASPRTATQGRLLSEAGVPASAQAASPVAGDPLRGGAAYNEAPRGLRDATNVNLGSKFGPDNIYGSSSKPGGRINSFVGVGDPNRQETPQTLAAVEKLQNDLAADRQRTQAREFSNALERASQGNAGAINARFDALYNNTKGSYSAKGKGNENKRLLEIEAQRANALEADSRNTAMLRGQSLQAQTQYNENATKNREISVRDAERRDALRAAGMPKPLDVAKFNADQANKARENEEKGDAAVNKAVADSISRRFPGVKDDPTQAKQAEALAAFVRQAPPDIINRIRSQNPTEREEGIQLAFDMFDQTQKVNRSQAGSSNGISSDKPVLAKGESRGARLGDFAGPGSLSITDLGRLPASWLGMDYGKVQELDNGAKVPLSLLTDDEFGKNVTKVSSLAQQRELTRRREEQARIERLKQEIKK